MDSLKGKVLTGISITRCYKICDKYSVAVYVTIITDTAVLGPRQPSELGVTLTHEHLLLDYTVGITQPRYCSAEQVRGLKMEMKNLGKIRQFPYVMAFLIKPFNGHKYTHRALQNTQLIIQFWSSYM